MSITPVDKPPDGDGGPDETTSRRFSTLRAIADRFYSWFSEGVSRIAARFDEPGTTDHSTRTPPNVSNPSPDDPRSETKVALANFPERDHHLTYPGRELQGINSPDVVGIETDDGLRLSVPENPDATLTSDVWMPVEP